MGIGQAKSPEIIVNALDGRFQYLLISVAYEHLLFSGQKIYYIIK